MGGLDEHSGAGFGRRRRGLSAGRGMRGVHPATSHEWRTSDTPGKPSPNPPPINIDVPARFRCALASTGGTRLAD